jgi:hypothetical protein
MIELSISVDAVSPALQALYLQTRPDILVRLAGKTVEKELRAHFLRRNAQGNKQGWPSRGLWGDIAERTVMGAVSGGNLYASVEISISHPALNLKVHGGTVTPKRGKYLTLPATAAAYAAGSPREGATPDLKFTVAYNAAIGHDMKALADTAGTVWYFLARKTTHRADPDALPGENYLQTRIDETIEAYLQRVSARAA